MDKKLDFKKIDKELYDTKVKPKILYIDKQKFITFSGKGNPNNSNGDFQRGISLLYPIAYTLSMSYKSDYKIEGFINYVVPPLEGYWYQEGIKGFDPDKKDLFVFTLLIRLPDFITKSDVNWAKEKASIKKGISFNEVVYKEVEEGLVVQMTHIGPYDTEINTTKIMHEYMTKDYELDFSSNRLHHEIYISDIRKTEVSKLKTILRHPIKKVQ